MTTTILVPVFTGAIKNQSVQLCNARDLHAFLAVGRDFTTWIKERIAEYGFANGEDFIMVSAPPIRGAGNRGKRTDYHLTLDMGKELGMVERETREALWNALSDIEALVVTNSTEIQEAICQINVGMSYLNRWRGVGSKPGTQLAKGRA